MIKSLCLSNFKSIGKTLIIDDDGEPFEGKLKFAPLTIICGSNSSGKSTALQSILLLAQTLQSNVPSQTLVLNGPLVKLGEVSDIKSEFYSSKDVLINIELEVPKPAQEITEFLKYDERHSKCKEEEIYLEKMKRSYKYTLSNDLFEISMAIYTRTNCAIHFDKVEWKLNHYLSDKVKELMIKHQAKFSMTMWEEMGIRKIIVNMKQADKWYIIRFNELNGKILSSDDIDKLVMSSDDIKKFETKESEIKTNQNIDLLISFNNKKSSNISNKMPIMNKIEIKNDFILNNTPSSSYFLASHTNKHRDIITLDKNYVNYVFHFDNATELFVKSNKKDKLIGLKLNHFLPKQFVYVFDTSDLTADTIINFSIQKFFNEAHQYNALSVTEYNTFINQLFELINKYRADKITSLPYELPKTEIINNYQSFEKHVNESIKKLRKINISSLLSKYISLSRIEANKGLIAGLDENYNYSHAVVVKELEPSIQDGVNEINKYFNNNLIYIGPLREEPHLQYDNYIESPINVGIKGENCAGVLFQSKNKVIKYIEPEKFNILQPSLELKNAYLIDAVSKWLNYIGVASSVSSNFNGRYGYELKINPIGKKFGHDLTNVGVGVSQVLPIVITCLLAQPGSTIIIEQPELHLHPAMQTRMTDFFVATIFGNKQVIVETHSEYIINRLRLMAVNWPSKPPKEESLRIYFSEKLNNNYKDYKAGNTIFKHLEINEYAAMSDWPDGFFDESSKIADDIIRAATNKWKKRSENK